MLLIPLLLLKIHHDVRPDSMLILQAAQEVVEADGFDDVLDGVRSRIDEIESLHRTRELTVRKPFLAVNPLADLILFYLVQGPRQRRQDQAVGGQRRFS